MKTLRLMPTIAAASLFSMAVSATPHLAAGTQADSAVQQKESMPMMGGQQMGMPMMQMMQERGEMMHAHMQKMESHMANIEALLQQLVQQGKK